MHSYLTDMEQAERVTLHALGLMDVSVYKEEICMF